MSNSHQTLKKGMKGEEKAYHHGDLRNALVAAGLQVLSEQGAEALNLREVARKAGVSHAAPYRHFADKDALIAAIATDGFRKLEAQLRKSIDSRKRTAASRLAALGQAYVNFALNHIDHFRVMFTLHRERDAYPELHIASKACFNVLVSTVAEGQARGDLHEGDPVLLSEIMWSSLHGMAMLLSNGQITLSDLRMSSADELARRHVEWLLNGLMHSDQTSRSLPR
jgi:AcrR family transcriptional regulator